MPGQIIKRGEGTWLVRIPRGRDASGKRLYHNHTVKGNKRDAERYRTKTVRELDTGSFVEASQRGLTEYLEDWLAHVASVRVKARTLADYRSLSARYLVPSLGHRRLAELQPADIQKAYSEMQQRGLSARTIRYAHSVLHNALEQAVRWQLLARNPAKVVQLPRLERREMRALSAVEAARFLKAARGSRFEALWVLLLTSGLRPGEALALKWSDLDGDRAFIQRSLSWLPDGTWNLAEPKTARARRVVSLPASTLVALQSHRTAQLKERLAAGAEWNPLDLVFTNKTGAPLEWRVVARRYFRDVVASAGLGEVRPYDLRHSCATLLLAAGENVKVVSERLGHASATITLDTYAHVLPDMQQAAATKLEGILFADAAI